VVVSTDSAKSTAMPLLTVVRTVVSGCDFVWLAIWMS
jgi:hypothetical protein